MAADHLAAIHAYVATSSPVYATQLVIRIEARTSRLAHFPESGRLAPEGADRNVREVLERPYRILYRLKEGRVEIIAVIHMRQAGHDLAPVT